MSRDLVLSLGCSILKLDLGDSFIKRILVAHEDFFLVTIAAENYVKQLMRGRFGV